MVIDVRAPGLRLPKGRALALADWIRAAFASAARNVARVALRITPAPAGSRRHAVHCEVQVHLPDGSVTSVQERHRSLGPAVRRAVTHAWRTVLPRAKAAPAAGTPSLPAPSHARR